MPHRERLMDIFPAVALLEAPPERGRTGGRALKPLATAHRQARIGPSANRFFPNPNRQRGYPARLAGSPDMPQLQIQAPPAFDICPHTASRRKPAWGLSTREDPKRLDYLLA